MSVGAPEPSAKQQTNREANDQKGSGFGVGDVVRGFRASG